MNRVDDLADDPTRDDSGTPRLHRRHHADGEGLVLVGLVGDEQCTLTHRIGLNTEERVELLHQELQREQVRGRSALSAFGQSCLVDR